MTPNQVPLYDTLGPPPLRGQIESGQMLNWSNQVPLYDTIGPDAARDITQ